jgi:hypothetical protein
MISFVAGRALAAKDKQETQKQAKFKCHLSLSLMLKLVTAKLTMLSKQMCIN